MMETIIVELKQEARKSGGDKYEGQTKNGEIFSPYIPQSISRSDGKAVKKLKITIEDDVNS